MGSSSSTLLGYAASALGGALIGGSASIVLLTHGRVAGISGILGNALDNEDGGRSFRLLFLAGLMLSGFLLRYAFPAAFESGAGASFGLLVVSGALVGLGTRLSGGCTSGHGVCGLSRLSFRSLVATLTFMGAGMITVFVTKHLLSGAGGAVP